MSYFDGWKAISAAIGRGETWCREMATRADDPLPVFRLGGGIRIGAGELEAWLKRQEARRYGCESGCDDVGAP